ncbi:MAG: hypothetical protein P8X85_24305 [Desulfobacterales bacterium]
MKITTLFLILQKEKLNNEFLDQQPMASPQIKILLSLAAFSLIHAFVCNIRLSKKASKLANWLQQERPDLWSELNFIARNWNGGHPGLKLLYRRNVVDLPSFNQQYEQLRSIERQLLWGIIVGAVCIERLRFRNLNYFSFSRFNSAVPYPDIHLN